MANDPRRLRDAVTLVGHTMLVVGIPTAVYMALHDGHLHSAGVAALAVAARYLREERRKAR